MTVPLLSDTLSSLSRVIKSPMCGGGLILTIRINRECTVASVKVALTADRTSGSGKTDTARSTGSFKPSGSPWAHVRCVRYSCTLVIPDKTDNIMTT